MPELAGGSPAAGRNGLTYWTGPAPAAPRIIVGVTSGWLLQLDAKTGKPIPGPAHVIDLSQGGIVDKDLPIHISNIALFNPATQKADRTRVKTLEDGRKVRVFKANGEQVEA